MQNLAAAPAGVPWLGTSWKMSKTLPEARRFAQALAASELARDGSAQLFVLPPFTAVAEVADLLAGTLVRIGVQNLHWDDAGPYTGEISAPMAADCGATIAEIGHSERRASFGETDETVALKTAAALRYGLAPLVCVGETRAELDAGAGDDVLARQVRAALSRVEHRHASRVTIAYEPVWAIGESGVAAEPGYVDDRHARIKRCLREETGATPRVLYGGSVNAENCVALASQPHVDGLFVGRAAWEVDGFLAIVRRVLASRR